MMLWIRMALRNALRNPRRTALTVGTVVVGTALVTLAVSWLHGVFHAMIDQYTAVAGHIRIVDKDFAARESLYPLYENLPQVDTTAQGVKKLPGVAAVEPRILTGAVLTVGEEIGDNFGMVLGARPSYYQDHMKAPGFLVKGSWLSGSGEVVLGMKLAQELDADVGEELLLLGQTQYGSMSPMTARIVGLAAGDAMIDHLAMVPLEDTQWMVDLEGGALELVVYADATDTAALGALTDALSKAPELSAMVVQPWYSRDPWSAMMPMIDGLESFIRSLILFVAALAIFNTMSMSVLERTGEIGVLRAMGLSRLGVVGLFLVESSVIGGLGGLLGACLGAVPSLYLERNGVTLPADVVDKVGQALPMKATFYADFSSEIFVSALVLGLTIAVVGAMLPALRASFIAPVTAMQARR